MLDWQRSGYHFPGTLILTWASGFAAAGAAPIFDRYGTISSPGIAAGVQTQIAAAGISGAKTAAGVLGSQTGASVQSDDDDAAVQ